jgi:TatD DNase family protein
MAPVPNRGKRNEPSFIPFIVSRLAEVYQVSAQQVESVTTLNAKHMFGV